MDIFAVIVQQLLWVIKLPKTNQHPTNMENVLNGRKFFIKLIAVTKTLFIDTLFDTQE